MIRQYANRASATQEALQSEYAQADSLGDGIRIGREHLFWRRLLQTRCLPLSAIERAYMRREDSVTSVCCGKTVIESYHLVLEAQGERILLAAEQATVRAALVLLPQRSPSIAIGYKREE